MALMNFFKNSDGKAILINLDAVLLASAKEMGTPPREMTYIVLAPGIWSVLDISLSNFGKRYHKEPS